MTTKTGDDARNPRHKYCNSCGAVVGANCPRCGAMNEIDAARCCGCGLELNVLTALDARTPVQQSTVVGTSGQYTLRDIEELLALRESLFKEEDMTEALRQDDIDNLFKSENP